jgi:hypothetical protein
VLVLAKDDDVLTTDDDEASSCDCANHMAGLIDFENGVAVAGSA